MRHGHGKSKIEINNLTNEKSKMKKHILSLLAVAAVATASAQIPNNSFENWTNMGSYSNPDQWGTLNNTTAAVSVYTATQGTPGNPGSYYLKLTSTTVGPTVAPGIAVSGVLDTLTMQPKSGFAFSQRPASFTGRWQHMIFGSSQGSISVILTRWDTQNNMRETVATANQTLSGMAMSWANFTINFTYQTGNNPDTCIIVLRASGANPTNQDYLWVDNLAFTGTVGIENQSSFLNNVSLYPNPANSQLAVDLNFNSPQETTLQIVDLNGRVVYSYNTGMLNGQNKETIDISGLAKGAYLLRVIAESGTETKNFVIE
jgi:hypothetical protein